MFQLEHSRASACPDRGRALRCRTMTRDANREECARWLTQAQRDLEAAEVNRRAGYHEWACFLSQQAAEKALKAYLHLRGERGILGHSILTLLRRAAEHEARFAGFGEAKRLDEVYIPARYPNGLVEGTPGEFYDSRDSEQCMELARRIVGFVTSLS